MEPLAPMFTIDADGRVTIQFPDFPRHVGLQAADVDRLANALRQIACDAPGIGQSLQRKGLKRLRVLYPVALVKEA